MSSRFSVRPRQDSNLRFRRSAECGALYLLRPRQDSNLRFRLRRAALYPLSYGGQYGQLRCEPTPQALPC